MGAAKRSMWGMRGLVGILLMLVVLWGCSGSGGKGTQDYRPVFFKEHGIPPEGFEERINFPQGYSPPVVSIEQPVSGMVISFDEDKVFVRVSVKSGEKELLYLRLNGEYYEIGPDGTFSGYIPLQDSGIGFEAIEVSAVDVAGYAGRDRIALLRGQSVGVEGMAKGAIGLALDQDLLSWLTKLNPVLDAALVGMNTIELDMPPLLVEVTKPFLAELELTVNAITVKPDQAMSINELKLRDPNEMRPGAPDMARILADLSLKGIVLDTDARFISLSGMPLPNGTSPIHDTIEINDVLGDILIHIADPHRFDIEVRSLDINIDDLVVDIPTGVLLGRFIELLGVTPETYYISIPIEGWLAQLLSEVLNRIVNKKGLGLVLSLPNIILNIGKVMDILGGLPPSLLEGLHSLALGVEIEKAGGDADRLNADVGMGAWVEAGSPLRDYEQVLYLPPTISLAEALIWPQETTVAFAMSGDAVNRILAALTDMDFALTLALDELLPSLGLPKDMQASIALGAPPFMDIRNGAIRVVVPNLFMDLSLNATQQLRIALDLVMDIAPEVTVREGNPHLGLDLKLQAFHVCYLADRMGINRAVDIEKALQKLLPQIMATLDPWLEKTPLRITDADLKHLIELLDSSSGDDRLQRIIDALPQFTLTIQGIRTQGGYLSLFINLE